MNEAISFVTDYYDILLVLGAFAVIVVYLLYIGYSLYKAKKVPGEEPMNKEQVLLSLRQQRRAENSLMADKVGDLLLDMLVEGKITPERYDVWHQRFGKKAGLRDLLTGKKPLTKEQKRKMHAVRLKYLKDTKKPTLPKENKKPKNAIEAALQAAV
jgi:hypothetical protein